MDQINLFSSANLESIKRFTIEAFHAFVEDFLRFHSLVLLFDSGSDDLR